MAFSFFLVLVGTSVFTLAAYDHGSMGKNLKYTLISEHEDIFSIHPITGKSTYLSAAVLKPFEALAKYFPHWNCDCFCTNIISVVSVSLFKQQ